MELVWASQDLVFAGRPYPGFPILLWSSMESCIPANEFLRHHLFRGSIGSTKSWPNTGRALYDYFSFLEAHDLDWRDVDRAEAKTLVAAYRDYSRVDCGLAIATVRQRLHYICKFYEFALSREWVTRLPFGYEERRVRRAPAFLAHVDATGAHGMANDVMPAARKALPEFLNTDDAKRLLVSADNPHHRMIIRLGLQSGLRREEIASFPLAYVFNPDKLNGNVRNVRLRLDPQDGHCMRTKGSKVRDIYISRSLMAALHRYSVQVRGDRARLAAGNKKPLFLNQFGEPFADDGKGIERIVRNIGKKVGISVHPHMLRHTYATHTLATLQRSRGDIDPLVFVQQQLGHESIQTTMIYLHLIHERVDDAILAYDDELNNFLESADA